ncbi:hypothetical protein D3C77_801980 [compost metagenome]
MGNAVPGPQRQLQTGAQLKECDRSIFKLLAYHALRLQAQAVAVESNGLLQVFDA